MRNDKVFPEAQVKESAYISSSQRKHHTIELSVWEFKDGHSVGGWSGTGKQDSWP